MKTPEELAEEFVNQEDTGSDTFAHGLRNGFLAGYQAGKEAMLDAQSRMDGAIDRMFQRATGNSPEKPEGFNSSNNSNGWISVKDRLPEDGAYLVCYKGHIVSLAELVTRPNSSKFWNIVDPYRISCVDVLSRFDNPTYWMPLPTAPEEEKWFL